MMKKLFTVAILIFIAAIFFAVNTEKIFIIADDKEIISCHDGGRGTNIEISFIHSVQKSPVIEELEFDGENFILLRTRYKSHGVGLPFLESDGTFREEGDWFIMDDMNRHIKELSLRTGVGTELTVKINGEEIQLYKKIKPGTKVDIRPVSGLQILKYIF